MPGSACSPSIFSINDDISFPDAALDCLRKATAHDSRIIFERINAQLMKMDRKLHVVIRPNYVFTFPGKGTKVSAEPLSRWDDRHPHAIFRYGFKPKIKPLGIGELKDEDLDLYSFIKKDMSSLFVSATRYAEDPLSQEMQRWIPANPQGLYEYEIFAHGGIDVGLTLNFRTGISLSAHHQEIVFPGGIRSELIRSAREYDKAGYVTRVWRNLRFDPSTNCGNIPRLIDLPRFPDLVDPQLLYTSSNHKGIPPRYTDAKDDSIACYQLQPDPWADAYIGPDVAPIPRACWLRSKGDDTGKVYFFSDGFCAQIDLKFKHDGTLADELAKKSVGAICSLWPKLLDAGLTHIDAVLPDPFNRDQAYFFCRENTVLLNVYGIPRIVGDTMTIARRWPDLAQTGFDRGIDAVLPSFTDDREAYFFRGDECMRVKFNAVSFGGQKNTAVRLLGPIKTIHHFSALATIPEFGNVVDTVLPSLRNGEVYFFSGENYVLIDVIWNTGAGHILEQPQKIAKGWRSLHKAGLY
ncbi:hypothetical protein CERSUDRAFT_118446 [Gelatoporia subvermispora B]|uniref:Pierisin-like domain-containing protein n=1 Tax=Ceriporiopsis subvermispora (strain B) TaxID=914234 RepID=M2QKL3_CERS8|nr:hypothetical protein CERSUDRAFT_118446 [Gelatoporia subvermispora B]